ncbi:MAG: N-acetylmuramic acid 6-phosphate etherase [Phycisphaeraceae bacterium]|nr:N-acetylmuramic acid 6-phosphate etherase [Phycisphaeraceae bacterium]
MSNNIPQDRGHLLTEQQLEASHDLDIQDVNQLLTTINRQDQLVPQVVEQAIPEIGRFVSDVVASMQQGGRLVYIGAGTSGRLGVLDASECPPTFCCDPGEVVGIIAGGDGSLRKSSEGKEDDEHGGIAALTELKLDAKDALLGIAAGGTTPYVWGALAYAKTCGAVTGMLCCVALPKPLPVEVDHLITLPVGPEVVTGSTRMKAGTATKLALNMISTSVMVQHGKAWGNLMVDVKATNAKLRDRAARILAKQCQLDRADAFTLLDQSGGLVKVALVMHHLKLSPQQASERLAEVDGKLGSLLGRPII